MTELRFVVLLRLLHVCGITCPCSRYLHQASEEMHKFFEQQKADEDAGRVNCNASSTPKRQTTEFHKMKNIIEETREHVLRDRPFQRPVVSLVIFKLPKNRTN